MQLASTARRRHFPSGSMTPTWLQRALCILLLALAASDAAPDAAQLGRIEHHVKNPLLYVATLYTTDDSDIRCGGALIAPCCLVTAARSCPDGLDLASLSVVAASNFPSPLVQTIHAFARPFLTISRATTWP
ncbi:hypothetical protein AeMF1_006614 [Aphanomyces euteiches]|nr:hypothetical protein AeMF1_006614 [Aphanomyces euteiches]KAH9184172.1 hypothetical protein AeNC1_013848 [Aphanomyces euteiches]